MEQIRLTLEAARVNNGFTQESAAKMLEVDKVTLGKWERGDVKPKNIQLYGMAYLYKVPVECIILPCETT